jgi:hypothetical protein
MLSSVRNKANSRRCRVGRGLRDGGRGSCPNKANLAQRRVRTGGGQMVSPAPAGTNRAKQSQFAPKRQTGQVLLGKGFMVNYSCTSPRQNKANSWRCRVERGPGDEGPWGVVQTKPIPKGDAGRHAISWAHCAKQSQFATDGRTRPSPRACPERSQWARGLDDATPKEQTCKTNPISSSDGSRQGGWPGSRRDESCETKPARPEASDRASPVGKRSYGESFMYQSAAKQSQFPAVPGGTGPGTRAVGVAQTKPICPAGPGGTEPRAWAERNCAKRSQFGPVVCGGGPG